jgi:NADH:ubiquinone reductase (non-electrogenic)
VDDFLKVLGHDNIFAFGDCACPEGIVLPATAQVAQQQGKYLAEALNRMVLGKEVPKFKFHFLGMMANLGAHNSILQSDHVHLSGLTSWIAWRAAYLTRLGSWVNRVQVPYDW